MISKSLIPHQDFLYCRLQGLIWENNGLSSPFNLDTISGSVLATIYSKELIKIPLVINCAGIIDNDDHGFSMLFELIDKIHRTVYFTNSNNLKILFRKLGDEFVKSNGHVTELDRKTIVISEVNSLFDSKKLYTDFEHLENGIVESSVRSCFEKFEDDVVMRLQSTPIVANGVYNSSNLICDPTSFMWISIKLSDKLHSSLKSSATENVSFSKLKLLSVSLRSSPFTAAVGLLNKIEIEVIDHLGPKSKIFDIEELQNTFWSDQYQEYIYVGDFVFGGTEIKVAQAFAVITGCKLEKAIVIGSLLPVESFRESFKLNSLISLHKLNTNAKFALFEEYL